MRSASEVAAEISAFNVETIVPIIEQDRAEVRAAALEEAARTVDTATMSEWHFYHADSVEEIPRMVQKIGLDYRAAIGKQVRALATRSTEEPAK